MTSVPEVASALLPAEYDIRGKVVFITGAGRGIGKGIANVLAAAGAQLALNALTPRYVAPLSERIASENGTKVVPIIADVTLPHEVQRAIDEVMQTFGRVDILINNLGEAIHKPLVPGAENAAAALSDADLRLLMDLNLMSAIYCTRAVAPQMLARRSGKILNISSYTVGKGGGALAVYTAAKTALGGFTRAQALEWAPYGVQINAIAPGIFPDPETSGSERAAQVAARAARTVPLGREGQLREVGLLALYLVSSASDYMTGQTLFLDGGLTL